MASTISGRCHCSAEQIQRYRKRISGPLLDRIDIQVEVLRPKGSILSKPTAAIESSTTIRSRAIEARHTQLKRAGKANAFLSGPELTNFCEIGDDTLELLERGCAPAVFVTARLSPYIKSCKDHRGFGFQSENQHAPCCRSYRIQADKYRRE